MILTEINLNTKIEESYVLKGYQKLLKRYIKNDFMVFEVENTSNDVDLFILDLMNKRFMKISQEER